MSTVNECHNRAMELTELALKERAQGNVEQADAFFEQALGRELDAIDALEGIVEPTWSVLHRSAATLALDCRQFRKAEQLVAKALAQEDPPMEIAEELRDLLEQIHFGRHLELRGVTLQPDEIQLSLSGEAVGFGLTAADEFFGRGIDASKIMHRIVERRRQRPFRERGPVGKDIRDGYPVLVSVPRAASFSVTLKLGQPKQLALPNILGTAVVIDEFMSLMELINKSRISDIQERIPDLAYRRNFLGLAKRIAPDGERIRQVGFTLLRSNVERSVEITKPASEISLASNEDPPSAETKSVELRGTLGYADAIHHNRIGIKDTKGIIHKIQVPIGMMNDIVRPMWGSSVTIKGVCKRNSDLIELREISESAED